VFRPPRIIEGFLEIGDLIPILLAYLATSAVPTFIPTWAKTLLSEVAVATVIGIDPA
jgi:hypothetical protein